VAGIRAAVQELLLNYSQNVTQESPTELIKNVLRNQRGQCTRAVGSGLSGVEHSVDSGVESGNILEVSGTFCPGYARSTRLGVSGSEKLLI